MKCLRTSFLGTSNELLLSFQTTLSEICGMKFYNTIVNPLLLVFYTEATRFFVELLWKYQGRLFTRQKKFSFC